MWHFFVETSYGGIKIQQRYFNCIQHIANSTKLHVTPLCCKDHLWQIRKIHTQLNSYISYNDRRSFPRELRSFYHTLVSFCENKANLRDLRAATGLVIMLKFDPNHRFFSLCDFEFWCMTSKINRASLLYYIKLCVSFQIHPWIQTEVTLRKRSIRFEIADFLSLATLKFDGWPWKTKRHLFYTTSSFVHHFKSIGKLKLKLQSGNAQFGSKSVIFCPVWPWNLMDDIGKQ